MAGEPIPEELLEARVEIDRIDRELIALLAKRFALTHRIGKLKAASNLNPVDPAREALKLEEIRALCEQHQLNPQLVTSLFTQIMEEVVKKHQLLAKE
ncbi:MAG: chorismate mutase [Gammaproteobacteria bacterium]|nr:chorismate mutase [Gammaproteobacteria bacterium]MDP7456019.1 chorismate mutase [Gammaproteobacteria bacterium]HJO12200.1 chorismate mutase [Gammaproteobacteria bacterium]